MALIKCKECGSDVSDKAPHCIKCGAPIAQAGETRAAGAELTTVQETSKKLKIQILIASVLFWGGLITLFSGVSTDPYQQAGNTNSSISAACVWIGALWYIITKIRVWWHHG